MTHTPHNKMQEPAAKRLKTDLKIDLQHTDGLQLLGGLSKGSVDLVLTDPPYIVSEISQRGDFYDDVARAGGKPLKTQEEWERYKNKKNWHSHFVKQGILSDDAQAAAMADYEKKYLKFGQVTGKKYATRTDFGDWDKQFTLSQLRDFVAEYYRVLKDGGVCIIWFDKWKIESLAAMMTAVGFRQLRQLVWEKSNPRPLHSKRNLLPNALEFAVLGVKGVKPFNGSCHSGIFRYKIENKQRFHPTQKNMQLFEELVNLFTHEGDTVVDTFSGSGTTAVACKCLKRNFWGSELDPIFFEKSVKRLLKA